MSDDGYTRLNVNVNDETANELVDLKHITGTITEAVRRGIAVYHYIVSEKEKGRVIVTMNEDGTDKRELVLL